jgi:hypothetical protein
VELVPKPGGASSDYIHYLSNPSDAGYIYKRSACVLLHGRGRRLARSSSLIIKLYNVNKIIVRVTQLTTVYVPYSRSERAVGISANGLQLRSALLPRPPRDDRDVRVPLLSVFIHRQDSRLETTRGRVKTGKELGPARRRPQVEASSSQGS